MMGMLLFTPLFSAYIAFSVPAAVGMYWIMSTLTSFIQTLILQNFYSLNHMTAKQEAQRVELLRIQEKNVPYSYNPKKRNITELNKTNNGKSVNKQENNKKNKKKK